MADIKLTRKNAMLEKCHNRMADYIDGRMDCEVPTCSLYHWMPYRGVRNTERGPMEPDLSWLEWDPRGRGKRPRTSRSLSPEQRIKNTERLRRYHGTQNKTGKKDG